MISKNAPPPKPNATDTAKSQDKPRPKADAVEVSKFSDAMQRARLGEKGDNQFTGQELHLSASMLQAADKHLLDVRIHSEALTAKALDTTALVDAVTRYAAGQDVDTKALLLNVVGQNWPIDAIHLQKTTTGAIQLTLAVNTDTRYEKLLRSAKPLEEKLAELENVKLDFVIVGQSDRLGDDITE